MVKFIFLCLFSFLVSAEEITPYKFTDELPKYSVPASSRFTYSRFQNGAPDVVYYFSAPQKENFPIAFLCEGSSTKGALSSVIHFHRYFLQECLDLGVGVVSVEQWGIDGENIDEETFFAHYTRYQRLSDHLAVIESLQKNPPVGWNGQFVFIGVSEGGALVTELTTLCPNTVATINWCGASDWSWPEELWQFCLYWKQKSWLVWAWDLMPRWMPFSPDIPHTREKYDNLFQEIIQNPTPSQWMGGMTYLYHADAAGTSPIDYRKIRTPFLVVAGEEDSIIDSCDQFVKKAQEAEAPISYFRIVGMDHYVRHRPDVLQESFRWLQKQLTK